MTPCAAGARCRWSTPGTTGRRRGRGPGLERDGWLLLPQAVSTKGPRRACGGSTRRETDALGPLGSADVAPDVLRRELPMPSRCSSPRCRATGRRRSRSRARSARRAGASSIPHVDGPQAAPSPDPFTATTAYPSRVNSTSSLPRRRVPDQPLLSEWTLRCATRRGEGGRGEEQDAWRRGGRLTFTWTVVSNP